MSLRDLESNGWLKLHRTSRNEIDGIWSVVDRDLRDASIDSLSDDRRFATAYNAALQISKIVLAASGYAVAKGQSAHYQSFEASKVALATREAERLADYFDMCRRKRNHIDYDGSEVVTRTETLEILGRVAEYRRLVENWLTEHYPELSA